MNKKDCSVLNCTSRFGKNLDGVIYYNFPKDKEDRKKWFVKCGREATYSTSELCVCSLHFCDDDYETILKGNSLVRSLKTGVVPHLNVSEIKQEPLDSDEYEYGDQLSPSTNSAEDGIFKKEVDSSFFETPITQENQPNADISEAAPVEPIQPNLTTPVINSVSSSSAACAPSSLPASQNWSGEYDFSISFEPQEKTTKGVSWTYSKLKDKLYVLKDAPCPINFSAKVGNINDCVIRVAALYSSPEHASEAVRRCVNHSTTEAVRGVFEAEHLVRCESLRAVYEEDPTTRRHSVLVPFDKPPAGQFYSAYLYKFTCWGSCAGGPNRRPLMLIFTLERNGTVLGRQKLDVKICACPGRDRKSEEKQLDPEIRPRPASKRKEQVPDSLWNVFDPFTKDIYLPPTKKVKPNNKNVPYTLHVNDLECYEFLKHMKKFFEMCKTVNNLPPSIKSLLMNPGLLKNSKKSVPENDDSDSDQ